MLGMDDFAAFVYGITSGKRLRIHALFLEELRDQTEMFMSRVSSQLGNCTDSMQSITSTNVLAVISQVPLRVTRRFLLSGSKVEEQLKSFLPNLSEQAVALIHQVLENYLKRMVELSINNMIRSRRKTLELRDVPEISAPVRYRDIRCVKTMVPLSEILCRMSRVPLASETAQQMSHFLNLVTFDLAEVACSVQRSGRVDGTTYAIRCLLPTDLAHRVSGYKDTKWFPPRLIKKIHENGCARVVEALAIHLVLSLETTPRLSELFTQDPDWAELCERLGVYAVD